MAAFTVRESDNHTTFNHQWQRMLAAEDVIIRTIDFDGQVTDSVLSYVEAGREEVSYWIWRDFWGNGIATKALLAFLENVNLNRPMYARAAKDNLASRRVLEKCGFKVIGKERGFANARGKEIAELVFELT